MEEGQGTSLAGGVEGNGSRSPGRRAIGVAEEGVVRAGWLEIRLREHTALLDDVPLILTVRELALLSELALHVNRVLTREELYTAVWGGDLRPSDRSVDVYVSRLRAKLAAVMPEATFIHTHFGIGYRFSPGL